MPSKLDNLQKRAPTLAGVTAIAVGQPEVIEVIKYEDNPNAIQRHDDGTMTYKRFVMTPVGLHVPDGVRKEELEDVAVVIRGLQTSIQWIVGDLMNSMERVWGNSYQTVAYRLGYEIKTVQEWASICNKVSIRMEGLSFGHHQLVAPHKPEDQQMFLQWALENKASVNRLRQAIAEWKKDQNPKTNNLSFSPDTTEGEHHSFIHLTRIRNAINGKQTLTRADVLKDAIELKKFAEAVIRDMDGINK